jgi:hypothetical protein
MITPIQDLLEQAIGEFAKHLHAQVPKLKHQTIGHRLRGAEDFARFLTGKERKNERIRGTLTK